jgi:hypothetical protein
MSKRESIDKQIRDIMECELYRCGRSFTVSDMYHRISSVTCHYRMDTVLTEMRSRGLVDKVRDKNTIRYQKPIARLLRERWISEMAETLCAGNIARAVPGQAARDVIYRTRASQGASQEACGGGV